MANFSTLMCWIFREAKPVLQQLLAFLAAGLVITLPMYHAIIQHRNLRNFRVVEAGALYRSGQMTAAGLNRVLRERGIRTVISLRDARDASQPAPDEFESALCGQQGVVYRRLSPLRWSAPDGSVPAAANVAQFVQWLHDPATPRPILIHCFAGVHRTGAFVAIARMELHGWSNEDAIREMLTVAGPREVFEADQLDFLRTYRPLRRFIK